MRLCVFAFLPLFLSCSGEGPASPPLDLLGVTYVVFSPEGVESSLQSPIALGGETRPALAAPPPAEFRYRVRVPERAVLTFAVGIANEPGADPEAGVGGGRVRFTVLAGERSADETLFDRQIHAIRRDRWLPQTVDLRRFAGREIWLVFQTSVPAHDPREGPLSIAGVFGEPVLHDRSAYRQTTGVVLISIDTLRRDHVSLYGYPRRTTPGLDAFARQSVVFEDAVSTSSWTLPAHASLMTSTTPGVHGATSSGTGLSPEWPGLARLLNDAGYFTQAMVTHVYLSKEYGFGEGFDRHRYLPETRAEELTSQAIRFLEARGDGDFFLFLHYYDPHWHYDPPPPYDRAFDPSYRGKISGIWWDFKELDESSIAPEDLNHIRALYDGEILYTDRQLERLFQEMKRLGIFDRSLIVVTSDHGEEFLEHGHWEHQKTLYEEQLRVPLLIRFPRGAMGSRRVEGQVSLIDVAPTILEALGVPAPPTFQGRSLLDRARGRDTRAADEAWAETEHTLDGSRKLSLRRGAAGRKSIFTLKEESVGIEVFDLEADPGEKRPLSIWSSRDALLERLQAYLADAAGRRRGKAAVPEVELDPEELERLRALGYVK